MGEEIRVEGWVVFYKVKRGRKDVHGQGENLNNSDTMYELAVPQSVGESDRIFMTSFLCVSVPIIEAEGMVATEIVSWTDIEPTFGTFILWGHGIEII